jgi:hypothetical protein
VRPIPSVESAQDSQPANDNRKPGRQTVWALRHSNRDTLPKRHLRCMWKHPLAGSTLACCVCVLSAVPAPGQPTHNPIPYNPNSCFAVAQHKRCRNTACQPPTQSSMQHAPTFPNTCQHTFAAFAPCNQSMLQQHKATAAAPLTVSGLVKHRLKLLPPKQEAHCLLQA